jgi:mRNA interferase RelE/StbE
LAWTLKFDETALKRSKKLDIVIRKRIKLFMETRVAQLENPRDLGTALSGKLAGHWRYRVGDYRIICKIEDQTITILVIDIGHRREIYR